MSIGWSVGHIRPEQVIGNARHTQEGKRQPLRQLDDRICSVAACQGGSEQQGVVDILHGRRGNHVGKGTFVPAKTAAIQGMVHDRAARISRKCGHQRVEIVGGLAARDLAHDKTEIPGDAPAFRPT